MNLLDRLRTLPVATLLTVLVLTLIGGSLLLTSGSSTRTVTAEFDRTVGLFVGSDVRVMGMRVGKVTEITPYGTAVRVEMSYGSEFKLPADVQAVLIAPSVIADRFVQLTPGYVDGPVLASGAVIGIDDTRIPVELDESLRVTTDLATALGPDGANRNGALAAALKTMAGVLDGTGKPTRRALRDLAAATDVISAGAEELGSTVKNLSGVTGTLARYDADVRTFNTQLGAVSASLAGDSERLSDLLATLAGTLGEVTTFVQRNRGLLTSNVEQLASVASALVSERKALSEILDIAPLAFTNLTETYDAQAQAVRTRANFTEVARVLDQVICDTLKKQAGAAVEPLCAALRTAFDQLDLRGGLPAAPSSPVSAKPSAAGTPRPVAALLGTLSLPFLGGAR
ncbi:MAG: MCE family protein [Propionibacteriales bacterium]|nr:MCE family protein [Propionibacteriales bacterium]